MIFISLGLSTVGIVLHHPYTFIVKVDPFCRASLWRSFNYNIVSLLQLQYLKSRLQTRTQGVEIACLSDTPQCHHQLPHSFLLKDDLTAKNNYSKRHLIPLPFYSWPTMCYISQDFVSFFSFSVFLQRMANHWGWLLAAVLLEFMSGTVTMMWNCRTNMVNILLEFNFKNGHGESRQKCEKRVF